MGKRESGGIKGFWKEDWEGARQNWRDWWNRKGLVLWATAPRNQPWDPSTVQPIAPEELEARWLDPEYRIRGGEYNLSRTYFGGDSFPYAYTCVGPGDLAPMLGSGWHFAPDTVWFSPCITDPDRHPPLLLDRQSKAYRAHLALIEKAVEAGQGRYLASIPDLVENVDILASLRDAETLMMEFIERPEWIHAKLEEINQAWFEVFDDFYAKAKDNDGGSVFGAFAIWGPGKTAKLQCDASAMFSPDMFREFVVPSMTEQCEWLDNALYHLDGEQAMCHLDALLEIEPLDAIEWTPVGLSRGETGGAPRWYDLYRRILKGGKSVQAIHVKYDEVIPLLDAVGGKGMMIMTSAENEDKCRELEEKVKPYRA